MKLRKPVYADKIRAETQNKFGGLRHLPQAGDGELFDMRNLTAEAYPLLQTRKRRWGKKVVLNQTVYGFSSCDEYLVYSAGGVTRYGTGPGNDSSIGTSETEKRYARLNNYMIVMPDEKYFYKHKSGSILTGTMTVIATASEGHATFKDGTIDGLPATANTIHIASVKAKESYGDLKAGDAITISGCEEIRSNNLSAVIREIEFFGTSSVDLRFYENTFTLPEGETSYKEAGSITITRQVPEMDFVFEHENRLWGYKGNTIYASKLGDPFNWNVYEGTATDAWSTPVLSEGDITGACSYGGYPIFFKENSIIKVYGSIPSEFRVSETVAFGVKEGSALSVAEASGVLFYLSHAGVCAYTGTTPSVISAEAFGRAEVKSGVGGSDTRRYFLSAVGEDGSTSMLVYDVDRRLWHREEAPAAVGFGCVGDTLCFMDSDGVVWSDAPFDIGYKEEESLPWMAEFGDSTVGTTRKKTVTKVEIRAEVKGTMTVSISHDGGDWKEVATVEETDKRSVVLPVRPRRADRFRLRLEGEGDCTVYSIATYRSVGSSK